MTRKSLFITIAIVTAAGATLFWAFMPSPALVEVAQVTRGTFIATVNEDGVTRVRDRYVIAAPVAGLLLRPRLRPGDVVAVGSILASITPSVPQMLDPRTRTELAAQLGAAGARRARAAALVAQARAAHEQAAADATRVGKLARQGFVAASAAEQADLTLDLRAKDLEAARLEQHAAEHEMEQARAATQRAASFDRGDPRALASWDIRSPIGAQVLRVVQESGGPIAVGAPVLELGDIGSLEAVIDVLSIEAARVKPGAAVSLDAGNGMRLNGTVRRVEPSAVTKVSALGVEEQRVNVIVDIAGAVKSAGPMGDGYRVDAQIEVAREANATQVPVAALFREGARWATFVVRDKRAYRQFVEVGARNTESMVVKQGLTVGEAVVLYPSDAVVDGGRVEISPGPAGP